MDHQMLLAPGEQAQLGKQGTLNKTQVNVASVIAWKNGFFNFSHTDFQEPCASWPGGMMSTSYTKTSYLKSHSPVLSTDS